MVNLKIKICIYFLELRKLFSDLFRITTACTSATNITYKLRRGFDFGGVKNNLFKIELFYSKTKAFCHENEGWFYEYS